jgi:hypothetical protein
MLNLLKAESSFLRPAIEPAISHFWQFCSKIASESLAAIMRDEARNRSGGS